MFILLALFCGDREIILLLRMLVWLYHKILVLGFTVIFVIVRRYFCLGGIDELVTLFVYLR